MYIFDSALKYAFVKLETNVINFQKQSPECSVRKDVLRNFGKSTGKHPVNFVKFLRTHFLQNTYGRLLLIGLLIYPLFLSFLAEQYKAGPLKFKPPKKKSNKT